MPQDFDQVLTVPGPGMDQWRLTILGEGAVGKTALAVQVRRYRNYRDDEQPLNSSPFIVFNECLCW